MAKNFHLEMAFHSSRVAKRNKGLPPGPLGVEGFRRMQMRLLEADAGSALPLGSAWPARSAQSARISRPTQPAPRGLS